MNLPGGTSGFDLTLQAARLPFESSEARPLRRHRQIVSWDVCKASAWRIDLPSLLALKSCNCAETCGDLCLRVVPVLVKLDTLGGTDAQKTGPHFALDASLHGAAVRPVSWRSALADKQSTTKKKTRSLRAHVSDCMHGASCATDSA